MLHIILASAPVFAVSPISGLNPAKIDSEAIGTSIYVTSFCANNALPLQAIFSNEWDGPYEPSGVNNADGYWYAGADLTYKGWRIAGFYRGELFIEANRDTVDILHMVKTKQDLPVGENFLIDLKAEGFSASGVELSKKIDLSPFVAGLNAGFTLRYLSADRIQHGTINGIVTPTGSKTYDFNLEVDYVYDKNILYNLNNSPPESGNGYSFDIGTMYNWKNTIEISLLVRDILGYIHWENTPYTHAAAVSDVIYYNDGYQEFSPTIKGFEGYKDFTQKIPIKTDVDLTYKAGIVNFGSSVNLIGHRPFYWLNLEYLPEGSLILSLGYNVNYNAYSLGIAYKQFQLKTYTDSLSYKRAKEAALTLSCGMEW